MRRTLPGFLVLLLLVSACGDSPSPSSEVDGGFDDAGADIATLDARDTEVCADEDSDGVCDDLDQCPGGDDAADEDEDAVPDACDVCEGFLDRDDADGDGVPDGCDTCAGSDDAADGDGDGVADGCDVCADGDDLVDSDGDGIPNACDECDDASGDQDGDGVPDDCDPCPLDEADDSDDDGTCDSNDLCPGSDDADDADDDGVPDGCDLCPTDELDDSDEDGVCDSEDICEGFDDASDEDADLVPDGCDACLGWADSLDGDIDGVPDGCDVCTAGDDAVDGDEDGIPDACDCDFAGGSCHAGAVCADGVDGVICTCVEGFEGDGASCSLIDCGTPESPEDGSLHYEGTTYGETATQSCDEGYVSEDAESRECQLDGTWSGAVATCTVVDCGALETIEHGGVDVLETTFGESAIHSCESGYELSGEAVRTCAADGTWSGEPPVCEPVDCGTLTDPEFGSVSVVFTTFGASAIYSCEQGYEILGVAERVCLTDGTWSREEPSCVPVDCGPLEAPSNGSVSAPLTVFESEATYACDEGHALVGDAVRTCTAEAVWDGTTPVCAPADCGSLVAPSNGSVTFDSALFGGIATYFCDEGYVLTGAESRECGEDGAWSGVAATCEPVDCGPLDPPVNGSVVAPVTTFEAAAFYVCDAGYSRSGDLTRTCGVDGTWSGSPPSCDPLDCGGLPDPDNGSVDADETTFGSEATYSCDEGFELFGTESRTCQVSGVWSDSAPECVSTECGALDAPMNGSVSHSGVEVGDTASFACDAGYELVGSATRTCAAGGVWDGASPSCALIDCGTLDPPENGSVSIEGTAVGNSAIYSCDTGYNRVGDSSRTCLESGEWSGDEPSCPPVDCGAPPSPASGSVAFDSTTYLALATYSCDPDRTLTGSATRSCEASGSWSGSTPTCTGACDPVTDIDGNAYPVVEIGSQCWMAANLNTTRAADGSAVSRWCCDCGAYGGMYSWAEVMNGSTTDGAQGICPDGWHVPSNDDWFTLESFLDPTMTDPSYTGWSSTTIADDLYIGGPWGFDWITAGFSYGGDGCSYNFDRVGYWTSSDHSSADAISRFFNTGISGINRDPRTKTFGFYVRCVLD